jgi:hypothetical protein
MATQIRIGLVIVVAGIVLVLALGVRRTAGVGDEFRFDAAKLKDHSTWIQVNAEPYQMAPTVAAMCARPVLLDPDPHAKAFITVYVNKVGREAMFAEQALRYPEGSVIVKEKFNSPEDRKPLLYTIMRKREHGYNPKVGDWEFSIVGSDGRQLQQIGKLENCQGCHLGKSDSDFVFRPYVKSQ